MQTLSKQEPIGLLVAVVRRRIKQAVMRRVAPYGLSSQQFWMLNAIRESPGTSARALAQRQHMDDPTASRVIAALVKMKLVQGEADPDDRRKTLLQLTAKGQKLAVELAPFALQVRSAADSALSASERIELRRLLHKVLDGVGELDAGLTEAGLAEARR